MSKYRRLASEAGIWLSLGGFQEVGPDPDHIYNTHVILNSDGTIVASYRKVMSLEVAFLAKTGAGLQGLFQSYCSERIS